MSLLFTSSDYKHWSFSFSISPSNDYLRHLFFRIDRFDFLALQGTLKRLQHHSSKALILQHSGFFMVQLSYLYMTTGKTIALTIQTFVGKVMSLFVIIFLQRNKCLLISWLQSPFAIILEPCTVCLVPQSCPPLCNPMSCSSPGSSVHGDSQSKNTGVSCHALLQGIFPTQGSNPGLLHLLHSQAGSLPLAPPEKPPQSHTCPLNSFLFIPRCSLGSQRKNWTMEVDLGGCSWVMAWQIRQGLSCGW